MIDPKRQIRKRADGRSPICTPILLFMVPVFSTPNSLCAWKCAKNVQLRLENAGKKHMRTA